MWRQIWVLSWQLSWHHYQSYIEEEADNESGGAALDQLTQFIFHSASAELSLTITATNCFVNLNMGEGEGRREEAANISYENSFYLKPGFCILGKKNSNVCWKISSLFDIFSSYRISNSCRNDQLWRHRCFYLNDWQYSLSVYLPHQFQDLQGEPPVSPQCWRLININSNSIQEKILAIIINLGGN